MAQYQVQDPQGQMHVIEGPDGASPDEVLKQAQSLVPTTQKDSGGVDAFERGFGNNIPLAPQAIAAGESLTGIGDEGGYSKNLSDWNSKIANAKEEHPVAYDVGAVGGAIAPAFIPGVGAALESSPVLGNAALGAANAVSNTDFLKNPGGALKQAAGGAAIGGAVGKLGQMAGDLLTSPDVGQRIASKTTSQALDISPLAARKIAAKAGTSPEQAVLDLGNEANQLIPNLVRPLDTANSKFSKVLAAHDDAGKMIGQLVRSSSKGVEGNFPEAQETINALKAAAKDYDQVDGGDLALQKTAERLEALQSEGKLDFDRLSKMKSAIGRGFNKTDPPAGTEDIYGIINDKLQGVVDRLSVEDPSLAPQFDKLKRVYTVTSRLLPAMSRTAAREVSGASMGGGLFSKAIPAAIGGAIGGPPGAILGAGAKYLQEAIAPDLGKNLAYNAMNAAKGSRVPGYAGRATMSELNDFLASKYGNQKEQ